MMTIAVTTIAPITAGDNPSCDGLGVGVGATVAVGLGEAVAEGAGVAVGFGVGVAIGAGVGVGIGARGDQAKFRVLVVKVTFSPVTVSYNDETV